MAFDIRRVEYFYVTVRDRPGEGYRLLSTLAELGVNLLAFSAIPVGPMHTQMAIFPDDPARMKTEASKAGIDLDGPYAALLARGDDRLGALAEVHMQLYENGINVFSSSGVSTGDGRYGCVVYVRSDEYEKALDALAG
jgi:predicted amino acid-binding ACT domain protein